MTPHAVQAADAVSVTQWEQLGQLALSAWPIWVFGLLVGLLFPRQPLMGAARTVVGAVGMGARDTFLARLMILVNGAMFIQTLWYRCTNPGTFRRLLAQSYSMLTGEGSPAPHVQGISVQGTKEAKNEEGLKPVEASWYVTGDDLEFFRARVERQQAVNAGKWEDILDKTIPASLVYKARRRMLNDIGKTEYMSTSITADTTPHEVMDFYLSDPDRQKWDNMLTKAETIKAGSFPDRELVVHWMRSFPFAFLSDRDYIIARRFFAVDDVLYGISKVVPYPSHDAGNTVVMDQYWSMWSCKAAPCPFGSGRPATETTLLHMEDFKIAENLSRFAVKCGMWGFVKKMTPFLEQFVKDRRARGLDPNEADPAAFGHAFGVAAPAGREQAGHAERGDDGGAGAPMSRSQSGRLGPQMRRVASAVVAGGMLLALGSIGSKARDDHHRVARKKDQYRRVKSAAVLSRWQS